MASTGKSRWADDEEDAKLEAQRKREREEKKRAKAEKHRKLEESEYAKHQQQAASANGPPTRQQAGGERPAKKRRLSTENEAAGFEESVQLLRFPAPEWGPCRHVDNFEKLNHIEEGSYGWVSRARESATGEIVALKKLKMDNLNDGFPVTGLREIQTLMNSQHPNVVTLREVVMGDTISE